ncbi:enhanced serine sensitivity protein SseB [Streptomyces rectiverticillatus]|uniref:enhanced serine sensitivity protein SseB C-terminal domain-containing protein n=1 Tax=Streptomyces rectiverticillatus TaxID=173860 RepID=UPI0015C3F457|nr:enhanced serine sensitivity protein SseB C-terminal domain-containing protein [Streptomyces rectiverticillatus]QLE72393.1 enhanced serine sensitivity protein SseB [Streptomyces rectiverticillatus]
MFPANKLEETLAAAKAGSIPAEDILKALAAADLWMPLPEAPGGDQGTRLPIVSIDGRPHVAVYTSAEQLKLTAGDVAHAVMGARELINSLPQELGLALNPGGEVGLPIHAAGVQAVRDGGRKTVHAGESIRLGEPAEEPLALLTSLRRAFGAVPTVSSARRALMQVGEQHPGLLIGVTVRDAAEAEESRGAVLAAVSRAVSEEPVPFTVDTVFLGNPNDQTSVWMTDNVEPFYVA